MNSTKRPSRRKLRRSNAKSKEMLQNLWGCASHRGVTIQRPPVWIESHGNRRASRTQGNQTFSRRNVHRAAIGKKRVHYLWHIDMRTRRY